MKIKAFAIIIILIILTGCTGGKNMNNSSSDINILDSSSENSEGFSSAVLGQQSSSEITNSSSSKDNTEPSNPFGSSSTVTSESVNYGDVKPVVYNPSTSLKGSIQINLNKVINSNIIGPGVNFDFCAMVPINLETGVEWDSIHSQHIPYTTYLSENEAKREWDNYFKLIDFMDFKYVRMSVSLSMWEPVNDNNDSQNTDFKNGFVFSKGYEKKHPEVSKNNFLYMEAMYKILDHFEKTGKYVILANWDRGGNFCTEEGNWLSLKKPDGSDYGLSDRDRLYITDLEEYTESMAAIMYHLKVEKGYNCVKGISFWNEPEGLIDYENVLTSVYNSLGAQLRRLGIRDKVLIQAYDGATFWNNEKGWVTDQVSRMLSKCGDNMDIISLHDYFSRMDSLKNHPDGITHGTLSEFQLPKLIKPAIEQAKADGKDRIVVMGELGTFAFGGNVETNEKNYSLQLHNAEAIILGLNNGVKGFGNWIYNLVYHKYYSMIEVGKNQYREFTPDDINYYPTSLYTKYIKSGSDVVETSVSGLSDSDGQRVHCVSVKNGNDITVLLVNDAPKAAAVKLEGLPSKSFYHHYVLEGKTDRIYPGVNYKPAENNEIFLRPRSITVLTTYSYGTQTVR